MGLPKWLLRTQAPASLILLRLMVGWVFLSEGLLKFLEPETLGAGRMARIGIPWPDLAGPFVGGCEVICGGLILLGLLARPAAMVLWINISVAILSTKIPILLGHGFWGFSLPKMGEYGFWAASHEARTDLCMWLGCLALMILGAGRASIDAIACRSGSGRRSEMAH